MSHSYVKTRTLSQNLVVGFALISLCAVGIGGPLLAAGQREVERPQPAKRVIGATATVEEAQSDFQFEARVDTGATTTSVHVAQFEIKNEAKKMADNLGKVIRFRLEDGEGNARWLQRRIAEISTIKTSERAETRYKVPLTLDCDGVKKNVLVSLNDRSHMTYPMLLGRNFLEGDFLVDVEIDSTR